MDIRWLIELSGTAGPFYLSNAPSCSKWTPVSDNAVAFVRKQDAEAIIKVLDFKRCVAVEHGFTGSESKRIIHRESNENQEG